MQTRNEANGSFWQALDYARSLAALKHMELGEWSESETIFGLSWISQAAKGGYVFVYGPRDNFVPSVPASIKYFGGLKYAFVICDPQGKIE